jgi:hypothetical protein
MSLKFFALIVMRSFMCSSFCAKFLTQIWAAAARKLPKFGQLVLVLFFSFFSLFNNNYRNSQSMVPLSNNLDQT